MNTPVACPTTAVGFCVTGARISLRHSNTKICMNTYGLNTQKWKMKRNRPVIRSSAYHGPNLNFYRCIPLRSWFGSCSNTVGMQPPSARHDAYSRGLVGFAYAISCLNSDLQFVSAVHSDSSSLLSRSKYTSSESNKALSLCVGNSAMHTGHGIGPLLGVDDYHGLVR